MARKPTGTVTYADVEALPSIVVGEIIAGELYVSPRPAARHVRAASRLGALLDGPFDRGAGGPGGWIILDEPELHLGAEVVVPDLAGWRRERMSDVPDVSNFELAPDWICEVLSERTAAVDRERKMPIYARAGVQHAWLIDPVARTLETIRFESGELRLVERLSVPVVRAEPFDAVELDLALLWVR